jgi:DNA-binding MarR family transcriptional regulator
MVRTSSVGMSLDTMLHIHHMRSMSMNKQVESSVAGLVGEVTKGCLLTRTRRISRVVTAIYDEAMRPHGVNAPQFSLLVLIAKLNGASRAEIGRANHQERSTLTRNLSLLLDEGWIEEVIPKGGRSRPILITETGRELLASAGGAWRSAQLKAKQLLGSDGVAAIVSVADRIPLDHLAG